VTYAEATLATGPSPRAGVFWTDRAGPRWAIAVQVGVSSMSSIGMLVVVCPP